MTSDSHIIAEEGRGFIVILLITAVVLFFLHPLAGLVGLFMFCFCLYFFRNPKRQRLGDDDLLTAPADGRVVFVGRSYERHFLKRPMQKVSIFMSPLDVHVNRSPTGGAVKDKKYQKGRFGAAFKCESSEENEQMAIHLRTENGFDVVFVQIAGWFARRIVCYLDICHVLKRGQIFGMIKFGSRLDVYLPQDFELKVSLHQKVRAGESVLARFSRGAVL